MVELVKDSMKEYELPFSKLQNSKLKQSHSKLKQFSLAMVRPFYIEKLVSLPKDFLVKEFSLEVGKLGLGEFWLEQGLMVKAGFVLSFSL